MIEEIAKALRTGSCFIAPAAARDLLERASAEIENLSGQSLERFYKIERLEAANAGLTDTNKDLAKQFDELRAAKAELVNKIEWLESQNKTILEDNANFREGLAAAMDFNNKHTGEKQGQ